MATVCPKCAATSGDDWSQCGGDCPMPMSPHFANHADTCLTEEEWIDDCVDILTSGPFYWPESNARSYASGLLSFFGVAVDPEAAIDEDRQYWEPAP